MARRLPVSKKSLLKEADIFSTLSNDEINIVAQCSEFCRYKKDSTVFLNGDPGSALFIVESGEVVVQKQDDTGGKSTIARFVQGDCFGELDLFTDTPKIASAYASADAKLLVFPKNGSGFSVFLSEYPALSARILHKLLVTIAGRIRRANTLVKENSPLVQELKKQVYRDKLTGIFNHTFLIEKIREIISSDTCRLSILIVKPDNFKELNDTYGHDAGDIAIRILARRLRNFIGDDSRIARYKGNAMAVLLPEVSKEEASVFARDLLVFINNLDVSKATKGNRFPVSASIGISVYPDHGENAEELLFKTHELPLIGRNRGGNIILFPEDSGEQNE